MVKPISIYPSSPAGCKNDFIILREAVSGFHLVFPVLETLTSHAKELMWGVHSNRKVYQFQSYN